jgi:hypothetical protein
MVFYPLYLSSPKHHKNTMPFKLFWELSLSSLYQSPLCIQEEKIIRKSHIRLDMAAHTCNPQLLQMQRSGG